MKKDISAATIRKKICIDRRYCIADPIVSDSSYTWTLTSLLGEMIQFAEKHYGSIDKSYTLLGIEFAEDGPQLWLPANSRHIIIQLNTDALRDWEDACAQLAHEIIHLLSPTGNKDASVLEEGLATVFQQWYMNTQFGDGWWNGSIIACNYAEAFNKTKELLAFDPNIISKIRERKSVISDITSQDIIQYCNSVPLHLADSITQRFV